MTDGSVQIFLKVRFVPVLPGLVYDVGHSLREPKVQAARRHINKEGEGGSPDLGVLFPMQNLH